MTKQEEPEPRTPEAEAAHRDFLKRCSIDLKRQKIRDGMAIRLHTRDRSMVKIVDEASPINCSWEELSESFKAGYRAYANLFIADLHSQGVGIRGLSLGVSHPHLVNYFTVEPLIEEK